MLLIFIKEGVSNIFGDDYVHQDDNVDQRRTNGYTITIASRNAKDSVMHNINGILLDD